LGARHYQFIVNWYYNITILLLIINIMITKNKNKKNLTIDLKEMYAKEYLESKKWFFTKIIDKYIKYFTIIWFILYIMISLWTWNGFISISKTNATELKIKPNLEIRDKIRLERLEVCQKSFDKYKKTKNIPFYIRKKLAVVSCAIRMHGVYVFESWAWKSEMCRKQKSCLWIKTYRNWKYWHFAFKSFKQEREIFADKYFKYHYKKNPFTFIYWFKQKNWKYKWGWASWNRKNYVTLLNKIENDKNLIIEYEQLYFTGKIKR